MDETISSRLTELNDRIVAIEKGIDYTNTETEKIQIASLAIEESIVTLKGNDAVIGDEIGEINSDIKKIRDFYAVKVHRITSYNVCYTKLLRYFAAFFIFF